MTTDKQPDTRERSETEGVVTEGATSIVPASTYKILGETPATNATGVIGRTTATSSITYGVLGHGKSTGAQGVVGAASDSAPTVGFADTPTGVWGYTDRSGADSDVTTGYGVYGQAAASSGEAFGVYGTTDSSDGYGLYTDEDLKVEGVIERDIGAKVEMSSNQTVSDDSWERAEFDNLGFDGFPDDRNEFNTSEYKFVCATDGAYRVTVNLDWFGQLPGDSSGNNQVAARINQNNTVVSFDRRYLAVDGTYHHNFSGVIRNASATDEITVDVYQNTGSDQELSSLGRFTNLSIEFLGQ